MARNQSLTNQRNNFIRLRFTHHRKKNPKWTVIAVIEEVAVEVYLSPNTVTKILKEYDVPVPSKDTVTKYTRQNHLS